MSWRTVVISKRAKLDFKANHLIVRQEMDTAKIHLSEILLLMIEDTSVSMTAYLLCELVQRKIKVIFCDEKRNPCFELHSYYGSHDTSLKIRSQIAWGKKIKEEVWTEIVKDKIRKQRELLSNFGFAEAELLIEYEREILFNDESNREGHAAKVYFNSLFGKSFTRSLDCVTNAALNYGYSIILSAFNKEIVSNGYLTQIGLFHDNMYNPFNLASDLMEPFRPIVDAYVFKTSLEKFDSDEKHNLINLLNKEVYIGEEKHFLSNAIKIYCKSVFDAINEGDISLIRFYRNEL